MERPRIVECPKEESKAGDMAQQVKIICCMNLVTQFNH